MSGRRTPRADDEAKLRTYVPEALLRWPEGVTHRTFVGTMVSADISGFTALSERLAALGREGVEELNSLINGCFDAMVADCRAEAGDVLKFGGDALLVLFTGERHVERACRAAVAMRRTIRRPRFTSDGKRIRLAVSTGVHTGEHTLHLVDGGGHLELIVTGPGATATVDAESAANAGEILLTPPTAALVPAGWRGDRVTGGVVLRRAGGTPPRAAPVPITRRAADFMPDEQIAQLVADAANEHRQVTICFLGFGETDALPVDEVHARLQALAGTVAAACERYGVFWLTSDVYHDGGKVILTAGAPISRGGDEDRMLRAVRDIVDADPGLALRAGINRGYVFAGDLGSSLRRTYTTMGDAMNLAARLMGKAGPGEIVASRPVIDWASSEIEYEPLEPFLVKGKSAPIHAGRLGRVLGRRTDLDRVDSELCGRADELAVLLERADAARAGRGSVSVITGDAGIGKSRLALEVLRRRADLTIAFARCQPYDRLAAYAVVEPLLRALLGIDAKADRGTAGDGLLAFLGAQCPDLLPMAPLVAAAIDADVPGTVEAESVAAEFRRTRTLQVLVTLIQRTVVTPTAVFVDDVNLADDASRELIQALTETAVDLPLLVIATSVPGEDIHPDPITLGPLDEADVTRLLDALLGEQVVSAEVVRAVVARSEGNPLFVGELVRALVEDPNAPMPSSLEALVSSRIDALDPSDRQLLRQASVLGTEIDINILGQVLGDRLIRRQDRWERLARFLDWAAPGVVRFRYDTYWRVTYGGLSFRARRAAHRRVIEVLESVEDPSDRAVATLLAAHSQRAGDAERTWRYAVDAATQNAADSNFGESARLYDMALEARRGRWTAETVVVAEPAADVFERVGQFARAESTYLAALSGAIDDVVRSRLLRKLGTVAEETGDPARARRRFGRARSTLAKASWSSNLDELAALETAIAALEYRQARYQLAWSHATSAMTQATLIEHWRIASQAGMILDNVVTSLRWQGAEVERPDVLALCRKAGDRLSEALHVNNLAVDLYFDGDWDGAARLYRASADGCAVCGHVVSEATALNNIAEILSDQGRYADAEPLFRSASRTWRSVGFATGIALAESNLGRLATRTGRYADAEPLLASALARFRRLGAQAFIDEVVLRRFENRLHAGSRLDAGEVDEIVTLLATPEWDPYLAAYAHRLLARHHALGGDGDAALAALDRSVDIARAAGIPFELAQSLAARAGVRRQGDAARDADAGEADGIFGRLGVLQAPARVTAGL